MHSTEQKQGVTLISNTVMKQHSRQLRAFPPGTHQERRLGRNVFKTQRLGQGRHHRKFLKGDVGGRDLKTFKGIPGQRNIRRRESTSEPLSCLVMFVSVARRPPQL